MSRWMNEPVVRVVMIKGDPGDGAEGQGERIRVLETTVSAQGGRITSLEQASASHGVSISSLTSGLETVSSDLNALSDSVDTNLDSIAESFNGLSDTVSTQGDEISSLGTRMDAAEDDMSAIETLIQSDSGYVRAFKNNIFNVKDQGAAGNGIKDDGWYIQNAVDAAHNYGGGIIYFPPGTYNISRTILYYSNITFLFAEGATVRPMLLNDNSMTQPTTLFGPYFPASAGIWDGTSTFEAGQRFPVEHVRFIGGRMSNQCYKAANSTTEAKAVVLLTCLCRDVHFVGVHFDGNAGGHSIEINSSTHVRVRDCIFEGYQNAGTSNFLEQLQIDAATCNSTSSQLSATYHNERVDFPDGTFRIGYYTYTRPSGLNYRMTGGYYAFSMLPPGDQYNVEQAAVNSYFGGSANAQKHGFHQCCHDVSISGCRFINNEGSSCHASAIGIHTDFENTTDNYADQSQDVFTDIRIYDNVFYWPVNRADGTNWRGVIAFGERAKNVHVQNCIIYGNDFHGTDESTDIAITIVRGGNRYQTADPDYTPQTRYRIYGNRYSAIQGWDCPEDGGSGGETDDPPSTICNSTTSPNAFLTVTNGTLEFCRVVKFRNRIQGLVAIQNISFASSDNGRKSVATINQNYRPYRPTVLGVDANAPIAGWFKASGSDMNHPLSGYVSSGSSTSTLSVITGVTGTVSRIVCSFEYPIVSS